MTIIIKWIKYELELIYSAYKILANYLFLGIACRGNEITIVMNDIKVNHRNMSIWDGTTNNIDGTTKLG